MATGPRHDARDRALTLLYEAEMKGIAPSEVLAALPAAPDPFTRQLVEGVEAKQADIDPLIEKAAVGWELDRMPVIDRNALRLAVYELMALDDVPTGALISEAVELVKEYSTDEAGRFVNGVLATLAKELRPES